MNELTILEELNKYCFKVNEDSPKNWAGDIVLVMGYQGKEYYRTFYNEANKIANAVFSELKNKLIGDIDNSKSYLIKYNYGCRIRSLKL